MTLVSTDVKEALNQVAFQLKTSETLLSTRLEQERQRRWPATNANRYCSKSESMASVLSGKLSWLLNFPSVRLKNK